MKTPPPAPLLDPVALCEIAAIAARRTLVEGAARTDWFVRGVLKSALVWLGFAVTLFTWMAFVPSAVVYRPAHAHLNLLGFASMMIYGVAYHAIARFTRHPLHRQRLAGAHRWLAFSPIRDARTSAPSGPVPGVCSRRAGCTCSFTTSGERSTARVRRHARTRVYDCRSSEQVSRLEAA